MEELFQISLDELLLNEKREKKGLPLLKNCRNAAAGSVRQLDSKIAAERKLEVFIYHLPNPLDYGIHTHEESVEFMKRLGFKTNPNNRLVNNIEEVLQFIEEKQEIRKDLPYDIDGVVIKINHIEDQIKLGSTAKYPKWCVAYKFPATEVLTELKTIIPRAVYIPLLIP